MTGINGTKGFCGVMIPKDLLWVEDGWTITVGREQIMDYTIIADEDYTYLYFTYNHSTKIVQIVGTNVVPEFPLLLILPLFVIAALITVIVYRRKHTV